MKCWLLAAMLFCITSLALPKAEAFVEDPYIMPAHPTPDTPISIHVLMGWCHASIDGVDDAKLQTVSPGHLRVITEGVVLDPGHPFCIHPPFVYRFNIGTLPEGRYTIQFFIRDDLSGAGLAGFGSVNFVVAAPARIPASSLAAKATIFLMLCLSGAIAWIRGSRA